MRSLTQSDYYTATIHSFGQRNVRKSDVHHNKKNKIGGIISTVLLYDVKDQFGKIICDHFWTDVGNEFNHCHLSDKVKFTGHIMRYIKGCYAPTFHPGNELMVDSKIGDIGNVEIISRTV